jgi:hypothetical protein
MNIAFCFLSEIYNIADNMISSEICQFFQHSCPNAGLIIPTNFADALPLDRQESYCGTFLNELNGNTVGGVVYGNFS